MKRIGTRKSFLASATGNTILTVASGAPVTVVGIDLFNGHASLPALFTFADADGTTFATYRLASKDKINIEIPFIAHNGIQITAILGGATMTVYHTSPGS